MAITQRRMDFLRTIKQLYESTKLPVHYVRVAELLGISKWSAYEMLKNLEKEGLVSSQYEVKQGQKHPGRAMVLFAPTHLMDTILSGKPLEVSLTEWLQIKERLLSCCEGLKKNDNAKDLVKQLIAELPTIANPMIFSSYVITILIVQLQTLSDNSIGLIKKLIKDAVNPESGIAMFVGAVIGSMPKITSRVNPIAQLMNHLPGLQKNLAQMKHSEQIQLMDFLSDALARKS
jgi:predicted transcriptional regulator